MSKAILFVCTGNTCRSPMAEGILRLKAREKNIPLTISSAGVAAADGGPISSHARQVLQDKEIEDSIQSKPVTEEAVQWAELILTMTMSHKRALIERYPHAADKIFTLKEYTLESELHQEREKLAAELEIKKALAQEITDSELHRLALLHQGSYDVLDPFGGSLADYKQCAQDIEQCLDKLLESWTLKEDH